MYEMTETTQAKWMQRKDSQTGAEGSDSAHEKKQSPKKRSLDYSIESYTLVTMCSYSCYKNCTTYRAQK